MFGLESMQLFKWGEWLGISPYIKQMSLEFVYHCLVCFLSVLETTHFGGCIIGLVDPSGELAAFAGKVATRIY